MRIYNEEPYDWKDLQDKVLDVFVKSDYIAESPKKISTARGTVEVDVFAQKSHPLPITILCECKYWVSSVPQTIIHGFRSVVSDIGAHIGIIIAKSGFQSGAYEVARFTNCILTDWLGFLNIFEEEWLKVAIEYISNLRGPLYQLSKPTSLRYIDQFNQFSEEKKKQVFKMDSYYEQVAFCSSKYQIYEDLTAPKIDKDILEKHIKKYEQVFNRNFASYNDFFGFLKKEIESGLNYYSELYKVDRMLL